MVCPVCASETFKVVSNKKAGSRVDIRRVECSDCGQLYIQQLQLIDICLNGQNINLESARRDGTIGRLGDAYVEAKIKSLKNAKL